MDPAVQIGEPILQSGLILLPCHAIYSRSSLPLQSVEAVPEQTNAQMVEQSGEPFLPPFLCCLPHTAQSLGHSFPALCRARVGLNDVLLGPRPSLPNLRRGLLLFVRLVHRYYGAVRLLRNVHVRLVALRLRRPVSIWLDRDAPEVSRFSCMLFLSVRGFLDYAGPAGHSRSTATCRVAFLVGNRVQRPNQRFSKLNHPAHRYPCLRFDYRLATAAARLGAKMDSLSPFL